MVSTSVLARRHACERVKHGGKIGGRRGPAGVGSRLSLAQKAAHRTALSRAPDGLSPTRGRRSPGLGRALAHAHSRSPPLPPALP
ncbi:unnamed protein product, partial [Gulo gulo]